MNPLDPDGSDAMVVAVIRRARQLVARGWCQCSFARVIGPFANYDVDYRDPDVTHLCLEGALSRAAHEVTADLSLRGRLYDVACFRVRAVLNNGLPQNEIQVRAVLDLPSLICYNDRLGRLQTEILELLDRAAGEK